MGGTSVGGTAVGGTAVGGTPVGGSLVGAGGVAVGGALVGGTLVGPTTSTITQMRCPKARFLPLNICQIPWYCPGWDGATRLIPHIIVLPGSHIPLHGGILTIHLGPRDKSQGIG